LKRIAIIPARGGSKRIPKKNIKKFFGKPIIAYSIETAINSNLFDEVMVSTDSDEISEIAKQYGAKVPFLRSEINADDNATTIDAIREVLEDYSKSLNTNFDYCCCIYPTAVFSKPENLVKGFDLLIQKDYNTVFPVIEFSYPIWRGLELVNGEKPKMIWQEHLFTRSQDLKKVYHDAGQWYWINLKKMQNSLFTPNSGAIVLKESQAHDIDVIEDWKIAELKYKLLNE
jgi:pseudaminic acid cytidylyltransferase